MGYLYVNPDTVSNSSEELFRFAKSVSSCKSSVQSVLKKLGSERSGSAYGTMKLAEAAFDRMDDDLRTLGTKLQDIIEVYKKTACTVAGEDYREKRSFEKSADHFIRNGISGINAVVGTVTNTWAGWIDKWNDPNSKLYKHRKTADGLYRFVKGAVKATGYFVTADFLKCYKNIKGSVNGFTDMIYAGIGDFESYGQDHVEEMLVDKSMEYAKTHGLDPDTVGDYVRVIDNGYDLSMSILSLSESFDTLVNSSGISIDGLKSDMLFATQVYVSDIPILLSEGVSGVAVWQSVFPTISAINDTYGFIKSGLSMTSKAESYLKNVYNFFESYFTYYLKAN